MTAIGDTFEWRGTTWRRGWGNSFFPSIPLTSGMVSTNATVFRHPDGVRWVASIVPSPQCKARAACPGTPGNTPQEALDGEVVVWLMTGFMLPGARELFVEVIALTVLNETVWPKTP